MTKKKVAVVALILICLALIAGTTFAYFTYETTAHNVITTGKVDFSLKSTVGGGGSYSDAIAVMPGTTVSKTALVKNSDIAQSAYVRAKVDTVIRDIVNVVVNVDETELAQNIIITCGGTMWTYKDGWWYYNEPLKPGEESTSLLKEVTFAADMDNKFQNCTATVTVTFQAVQAKNNGSSVFDATGWPA